MSSTGSFQKQLLETEFSKQYQQQNIILGKFYQRKNVCLKCSNICVTDYILLIQNLFQFIRLIPEEELLFYLEEAEQIMEKIDLEDAVFIAAALSQENAVVWSDDKHFDKQDRIMVLKTKHMVRLFKENSNE